jgi:hypothetical protein
LHNLPAVVTPWLPAEQPASKRAFSWITRRWPGLVLALLSLGLGAMWAGAIRPFNAPDEPAYLQTVVQVRKEHSLSEIHFDFSHNPRGEVIGAPGDQAVRDYAARAGIADPIRLLAYQTVQPPLYFFITTLVTQFVQPDPPVMLYLSRLVSVLFGAGIVYFSWAATRELAPNAPLWAIGVAGVIAFLPEFCFNNARVGNDSLVNCLGMASFSAWFRGLRQPEYDPWMLRAGGLVGLAVLSKLTALILVPALVLVVLFRAFQGDSTPKAWRIPLRRALRLAAGAGASLLLVCGWWFARNMIAYGEPTGTGAANVFWRLNLQGLDWNNPAARADFVLASWYSFWGYFGWQNIGMPLAFYDQALRISLVLVALTALAAILLLVRSLIRRSPIAPHVWQPVVVMALVAVLLLNSFVQFSLTVAVQAQGRYLYLLLLPAALLFSGGLYALAPGRVLRSIALGIPILWLAAWNTVGLSLVR